VKKRLLLLSGLMLVLLPTLPVYSLASALKAEPSGAYHPLKAAETESIAEGFEAAWLARLSEALGTDIAVVDGPAEADLRFGKVGDGAVYYSSSTAALTAAEAGPADWGDLAGRAFCVTAGSPHAEVVVSRFSGVARAYPSAAQALIGLKLGECQAVAGDHILLEQIAKLPEWRRFNRLLPPLENTELTLRLRATDVALQQRIDSFNESHKGQESLVEVTQHWIDEVAFQAYVLADTLDCH